MTYYAICDEKGNLVEEDRYGFYTDIYTNLKRAKEELSLYNGILACEYCI